MFSSGPCARLALDKYTTCIHMRLKDHSIKIGLNLTYQKKILSCVDFESDISTLVVLFALFVVNFSLPALFWVSVFTFFRPKPPLGYCTFVTLSRFLFFSKARNPARGDDSSISTLALLL